MAVYMSASRQRRRILLIGLAAGLAGVIVGVLLGRATASGTSESIDASRSRGRSLASALRALPIEYEREVLSPSKDISGIQDAAQRVGLMAEDTLKTAPWLGPGARRQVTDAVAAVKAAITRRVSPQEFQQIAEASASVIDDVFAVPRAGAP